MRRTIAGCGRAIGARLHRQRFAEDSGKLLRRSLQALAQGANPGNLSTLDDPSALEEVKRALQRGPDVGS